MDTSKGAAKYLARLSPDEKNTHRLTGGIVRGNPTVAIISESGLYKLVMRSDKPEAKAFQDWVTREVLASRPFGLRKLSDGNVRGMNP